MKATTNNRSKQHSSAKKAKRRVRNKIAGMSRRKNRVG